MKSACTCVLGDMFSRWCKFGWESDGDLFADANTETLSQAIQAAVSEEPDADGSVLFGHLRGTVVGLRYYTGVVRVKQISSPCTLNCICMWEHECLCFDR